MLLRSNQTIKKDMKITDIENKSETAIWSRKKPSPKDPNLDPGMPLRPGFGTMGREILLWTNYFELVSYGELTLYRYSIEILPEKGSKKPVGKKLRRTVRL